jgi:starch phosphorylase
MDPTKADKQDKSVSATSARSGISTLLEQYSAGPVRFTGSGDALYERHLVFDNVMEITTVRTRERFEAVARSVRDILSQQWVRTEETYRRENPKRVYYLSMEFLIGRSLANNITNLLLNPVVKEVATQKKLDWYELLEQEPDAGLGNGGLGRLAACFLDSMATMQIPAMGYGLRYEYGMFKQFIRNGWQHELPDNWMRRPDPWEVARPYDTVDVEAQLLVRGARRNLARRRGPALEFDRYSVRSARGGLRGEDHQHLAALGRSRARLLQFSRIQ